MIENDVDPDVRLDRAIQASWTREDIERLTTAFCQRHQLPMMSWSEEGDAGFVLHSYEFSLSYMTDLKGIVASLRLQDELASRNDLMKILLYTNICWDATAGGTFMEVADNGGFYYVRMIVLVDLDVQKFESKLMDFTSIAMGWYDYLQLLLDADADDPAPPKPEVGGAGYVRV
ncbi:MAG: type III secretion system chaperone [Pseudomonadota bacterium]